MKGSMGIEEGLIFDQQLPAHHRSGFVTLAGKPNVGKSTLLNAWLDFRLAAVSPKPQTTRNRLLGILTREDAQIVFVDTPGIHLPRNKLGAYMVTTARRAIPDADLVVFVVDVSRPPSRADREIARLLEGVEGLPVLLAMNKVDLVSPEEIEARSAPFEKLMAFDGAMCISALTGSNRDELLDLVVARLPLGPRYYPEDQLTDLPERFVAAELIREQVLKLLEQEVPHAVAVMVDEFKERPNGTTYISAVIYTERASQKGIVIGRGGAMLKRIGHEARIAIQQLLGCQVYLDLWVKVRKNWRRDERYLSQLGYSLPQRR